MKNNKGFTLIEVIATIGIMILVGLVIVNNMSGILSKNQDEEYKNFKKEIEESACMYVEVKKTDCITNRGCEVSIKELIENGYIADNLKDPSTNKKVIENENKYKVNVSWIDNVKTCRIGDN